MAQGKITISTITHKIVTVDGEEHTLRSKEYQMLCLLLERAPLCVTRREIISHVWSGTYSADATINQTMKSIRRKLGDKDFTLIQTIPRMGYQIEHPELFSLEPAVNHEPIIQDSSGEDKQLNTQSHYEGKRQNVQNILPVINENQRIKRWGMMVAIGIVCFICGVVWHGVAPSFPLLTKGFFLHSTSGFVFLHENRSQVARLRQALTSEMHLFHQIQWYILFLLQYSPDINAFQ